MLPTQPPGLPLRTRPQWPRWRPGRAVSLLAVHLLLAVMLLPTISPRRFDPFVVTLFLAQMGLVGLWIAGGRSSFAAKLLLLFAASGTWCSGKWVFSSLPSDLQAIGVFVVCHTALLLCVARFLWRQPDGFGRWHIRHLLEASAWAAVAMAFIRYVGLGGEEMAANACFAVIPSGVSAVTFLVVFAPECGCVLASLLALVFLAPTLFFDDGHTLPILFGFVGVQAISLLHLRQAGWQPLGEPHRPVIPSPDDASNPLDG